MIGLINSYAKVMYSYLFREYIKSCDIYASEKVVIDLNNELLCLLDCKDDSRYNNLDKIEKVIYEFEKIEIILKILRVKSVWWEAE